MQQLRSASPRSRHAGGAKKVTSSSAHIDLSVQDRRLNARVLHETERRKAQLLPLTAPDVARNRQRYYAELCDILDDRVVPASLPYHTTASLVMSSTEKDEDDEEKEGEAEDGDGDEVLNATTRKWMTRFQEMRQANTPSPAVDLSGTVREVNEMSATDGAASSASSSSYTPLQSYEEWLLAGCPTCSWAALLGETFYDPILAEQATLHAVYSRATPSLSSFYASKTDSRRGGDEEKRSDGGSVGGMTDGHLHLQVP